MQRKIVDYVLWLAKRNIDGISIPYRDDATHDVEYTHPRTASHTQ